ncbi:hypothetical protein AB0P12_12820 [Streptomyces subrutilus]|uniref:hypothetical protein n=1 Tax=Streptomyces subrutilus TaxID=36818 RepID=UPI0034278447
MQLRRAVPLTLVALLASAGCVSVGPEAPAPARGAVPPLDAPDRPAPRTLPDALPLGRLPVPVTAEPDPAPATGPGRPSPEASRPAAGRAAKPAPPRRVRPPGPATAHPRRKPVAPTAVDRLCDAAEGTVPPAIVDLCLREYGR